MTRVKHLFTYKVNKIEDCKEFGCKAKKYKNKQVRMGG